MIFQFNYTLDNLSTLIQKNLNNQITQYGAFETIQTEILRKEKVSFPLPFHLYAWMNKPHWNDNYAF